MIQNESDTLPFTNRFNYQVKEISITEFLIVLSQLDDNEDTQNKNEQIRNKIN